jgi:hypothetical protein
LLLLLVQGDTRTKVARSFWYKHTQLTLQIAICTVCCSPVLLLLQSETRVIIAGTLNTNNP